MANKTIHSAIIESAERNAEKTAFYFKDRGWKEISYAEFIEMAKALSSRLFALNIKRGERVAIISENRPEWPASYLGILMAGAVAVPIDSRLTPPEIRNIISDSGAACAIFSNKTKNALDEAISGLKIEALNLDEFNRRDVPLSFEPVEAGEGDIASLIYTSGTTGTPKAVMLTHGNILSDADALVNSGIVNEGDNVLSILPLHHTYPFMCTFIVPMILGAKITYPADLKGPELISAIKEKKVTILVGVPQVLELMRNRMMERIKKIRPLYMLARLSGRLRRAFDINLMRLILNPLGRQFRFLACGGARLDPDIMKDLEALGFTVLEGYGLTETSPIVAFNPPKIRKPGSVGRPLPPAEIKILNPSETGEGEIAIRGPMVMKGYFNRPAETDAAIENGWFKSGDLGYMDKDGYIFITGRLKEVIVLSSGKNIYPEEVENNYLKCKLIKEMCVFERGGRLKAVIVPDLERAKEEQVGSISDAIRWKINELSAGLPPHMRLMGYELVATPLPRTPLGKLRRFLIQKETEGGEKKERAAPEDENLISDEVGRKVISSLRLLLPGGAFIRASDNLELDLGMDSLRRIELAASLEAALSINIPDGLIAEAHTIGELIEKLRGLVEKGEGRTDESLTGLDAVLAREPSYEDKKMIGLSRGRIDWFISLCLSSINKFVMKVFFRFEAVGLENIPDPPFIIAPNHMSYLDAFVVAAGIERRLFRNLYFQGMKEFFTGGLKSVFGRYAHVIPIDPASYLGRALQLSSYVLKSGGSLVIFPEGGRSFDGSAMEFKKGIGILALRLNVPVIPAKIMGTFEALPRGAAWPKRVKITVTFGKPLTPSELDKSKMPSGMDEYQFFASELRKRVIEL